jgi:hypothetical protein
VPGRSDEQTQDRDHHDNQQEEFMGLTIVDKRTASGIVFAGGVALLCAPGLSQAHGQGSKKQDQAMTQDQTSRQQESQIGERSQKGEQHYQAQMSSEEIRQVQQKLTEMGFHAGEVDGQWGPQTQSAIKNFQQQKGLEPTGQLDKKTMDELGVEKRQAEQKGTFGGRLDRNAGQSDKSERQADQQPSR